jgi:hypothetical protein
MIRLILKNRKIYTMRIKPFGKKGGYKKRNNRPTGWSRKGLPKLFPPHINTTLQTSKPG